MSIATLLGLGGHELIALVGGGGKSTLLFSLGNELASLGRRVILTTTTKMGREQADSAATVCWSADAGSVGAALGRAGPVMLVTGGDGHKVTGPPPELVDRLFADSDADYVIVEADGSRGKPLKAPAAHEPVIPATSTVVVILVGIDAVGRPLENVAHRVEVAIEFTDLDADHRMTPTDCADVILHPDGALRSCPESARVIVGITKVRSEGDRAAAGELAAIITSRRPDIGAVIISAG